MTATRTSSRRRPFRDDMPVVERVAGGVGELGSAVSSRGNEDPVRDRDGLGAGDPAE